jgi:hypothetical protein
VLKCQTSNFNRILSPRSESPRASTGGLPSSPNSRGLVNRSIHRGKAYAASSKLVGCSYIWRRFPREAPTDKVLAILYCLGAEFLQPSFGGGLRNRKVFTGRHGAPGNTARAFMPGVIETEEQGVVEKLVPHPAV